MMLGRYYVNDFSYELYWFIAYAWELSQFAVQTLFDVR